MPLSMATAEPTICCHLLPPTRYSLLTDESTICWSQPESSVSLFFSSHETSAALGGEIRGDEGRYGEIWGDMGLGARG